MNYKVVVNDGVDSVAAKSITNVHDIQYFNEAYWFNDKESNVLFIAPQKNVVYIEKNN